MSRSRRLSLRTGAAALVAVGALATGASAADAGVLVESAPSCDDQAIQQTFMPWLDVASYSALAGGDFEGDGDGWTTTGDASTANGNESFDVGAAGDTKSLSLPQGSSATSPSICVGLEHPTVRFFVKRRSGGPLGALARLRVDALIQMQGGAVLEMPIGLVAGSGDWQPTLPMAIVGNLLPLFPGEHTPVAFTFTPQGGDWSVDDVWVDPYNRR